MLKKKLSILPLEVKASIAFFIGSLITSGISYITTPIYTRLLSPDEFGVVSLFLTWYMIFGIIAMFGLSNGVFNNGMMDYKDHRDEYSFSMLLLSNTITIIFSFFLFLFYPYIKYYINVESKYIILMLCLFMTQPAYNFWLARQRYELKFKASLFWSIFIAFISPFIAIFCIVFLPLHSIDARIFGAEIPLVILYVGFYLYLSKNCNFKINISYWKSAIIFNLPLIPHYLSIYLLSSSDRIMIATYVGKSETAYYTVAYSLASVVTIVWSAINSSLVPYTYEHCRKGDLNKVANVTYPLMSLFAVSCIVLVLMAPELILLMATKEYMDALYIIPPIVVGVFFQVQYFIYSNLIYYHRKTKYVMYASVIASIVNILLNYIFIPKFGYYVAGYTTLFSYIIQATIDYYAMKKVMGFSIYSMKIIMSISIVVVVIALASSIIYKYFLIRYLLVAFILLILSMNYSRILYLFKSMK